MEGSFVEAACHDGADRLARFDHRVEAVLAVEQLRAVELDGLGIELPATAVNFTSEIIDVLIRKRAIGVIALEVDPSFSWGDGFFNKFHDLEWLFDKRTVDPAGMCMVDSCR